MCLDDGNFGRARAGRNRRAPGRTARPAGARRCRAARSGAGPARCWSPCSARSCGSTGSATRTPSSSTRPTTCPTRSASSGSAWSTTTSATATACCCAATRTCSPTAASSWSTRRSGRCSSPAGEWLFGLSPFGWRFAAAVVGSLSILLLARIARRMTRSTLLGCFAGLLLALDGLEFVMSRTALLDIFVMFWVLAAFGCLVVDRDAYRARLAAAVARGARNWPPRPGPGSAGGGWAPGSASAWRSGPSGTACGSSPRSPRWPSPGMSARAGPPGSPGCRGARACCGTSAAGPGRSRWCRCSPTWPPGPAGSRPAAGTTGTGRSCTARTSR